MYFKYYQIILISFIKPNITGGSTKGLTNLVPSLGQVLYRTGLGFDSVRHNQPVTWLT
jgi:hypothetical protein